MSGIYIHIPFCKQACSYCDFYFITRQEMRPDFVDRLCEQIDETAGTEFADEPVKTVYFGGGTPSLLQLSDLERIFERLENVFTLDPEEVTIELNPDDVTADYLRGLQSIGIHRASMGVQSFNPGQLQFMHRAHTADEAVRALELLEKTGFRSFNADLIYGSPGQSVTELETDIDRLLAFSPPHISAYALTIEPGTRLGKQAELGRLSPADDEVVAEQFELIGSKLSENGIERYEVSNYSRPGFEAVHNTRYWNHNNYLGFGPSAHSFWWKGNGAVRWRMISKFKDYMSKPFDENKVEMEQLPLPVLAEERLMLGLRTKWGVDLDRLTSRYGYRFSDRQKQWLERNEREGKVRRNEAVAAFTEKGLNIADYLIVELLNLQQR